ncbi:MAG TPA: alkaline phosphatase family protein [Terriglobales bacterium]|nr:alkaline phosphatase family protein [Terriglobales bacterium]
MSESGLKYRVSIHFLVLIFLNFLVGCGGGGSSSSFPGGSVQLSVQATGAGAGTITSNPTGINCGKTCTGSFSSGTQVTLTASPAANSFFAGWSGSCSGTGVCQLTMTQNTSVTANFSTSPMLTVTLSGTGTGSVASNPSGINCGQTCSASFAPGTSVTLAATAGANSSFMGWTGGGCSGTSACTVTLSASQQVTATFNPVQSVPVLSVTLGGNGSGTVTSNPGGINCGTTCSAPFNAGTQVTLTETPTQNSTFAGWSVSSCGMNSTCAVTLNSNQLVTATFTTPPTLTVSVVDNGTATGTVSSNPAGISCPTICTATFPVGTNVTLTETPGAGSNFAGWGPGACSGNASTCQLTLAANQQVTATFSPQNIAAINHIIFMAQENRSFDHYFGAMREYWAQNGYPDQPFDGLPQFNPGGGQPPAIPGCNPADPPPADCMFDPTNLVTSYHLITQCIENPSPSWNESHVDWDYNDPLGQMSATLNGFVWTAAHDGRVLKYYDSDGIRAMGYYDGTDLNYYYFMASNFATSDRWFNAAMTRTQPNREYLIAATSGGYAYPIGTSSKDQALLTEPTIFQELQAANISWKIYVNPGNVCAPHGDPACYLTLSYVQNFKWGQTIPTQYPNNIGTIGPPGTGSDFENDLKNGTLPQVVQIEPASDAGLDEHPSDFDTSPIEAQAGAAYVSSIINAVMASTSWKDSAFVLTFDEFGGLYDHVSPYLTVSPDSIKPVDLLPGDICTQSTGPTCDFTYTGYRVPLVVVSPYAKRNYVSHNQADITAILKFVETRFNLSPLTKRDAAQIDMTEFFDFTNPVWLTPPTPPNQNTSNPCYLDKLP